MCVTTRIRILSRTAIAQQAEATSELGAIGLLVHGGHVRDVEDTAAGITYRRKLFERQVDQGECARNPRNLKGGIVDDLAYLRSVL